MKKKVFSKSMAWILSVAMMLGVFVVGKNVSLKATAWSVPISETHFQRILDRLMEEYPHMGTYSGTYYEDGVAKAWQCHGYACEMFRQVFDAEYYNDHFFDQDKYTEMGTIYAGDIIRIRTSGGGHSMFVVEVRDDVIYVTEANWPGSNTIRWDRSYTYSELASVFEYKVHVPGNTLTGCGYSHPIGSFDGVDSPAPNKLNVSGWAMDWDNCGKQLDIHVYVGGPAGSGAPCYVIKANTYRPDVEAVYPGVGAYHGYDATITVGNDRTGNQAIYVYAINVDGGWDNPLLNNSPKTVNIQKDTSKPVISNVKVTEVSESGYRVTCNVSDNVGVTSVKFPTWTGNNGQDDLIWHDVSISGNTATLYIKSSEHKNETGTYYTDIYAYDGAGNCSGDVRATIPQLKPYVVKYNLNGGSGSFPDQKRYYNGAAIKLNSAKPTKTGYSFVCWNTKSDGTGTKYNPGDSYSANADLTLYAIWKADTYTVSYNMNGGSGSIANQTKTYGVDLTLSSTKPTRTGYTFVGWNTNASATTAQYQPSGKYSDNKDAPLYAVWKANTYTISYNANGGTGTINSSTVTFGQKFTMPNSGFTKAGYTLTGFNAYRKSDNTWFVQNQGWVTESQIKDGNTKKLYGVGTEWYLDSSWVNSNATDTYTFYAVWKINTYTISYSLNGGVGDAIPSQTKTYGQDVTLSNVVPVRTGYDFIGWSTDKFAKTAQYQKGDNFTENSNTKLYAVWKLNLDSVKPVATAKFNGHTYEYYNIPTNWHRAYEVCDRKGGHIVTINSQEENDLLVNMTKGYTGNVWTGSRAFYFGTWWWITNEPFTYKNFADSEMTYNAGGDCIIFSISNGKWSALADGAIADGGFICEYGETVDTSAYAPVYTTTYNGHEYWFFDQVADWQTAVYVCKELGGHLVVVDDAEENNMILNNMKEHTSKTKSWLGISDNEEEGVWKDINGNIIKYSNWAPNEPDNYADIVCYESYAVLENTGMWTDYRTMAAIYHPIGFVCEFEGLCSVSYDMNGGTGTIESQPKTYGQDLILSSTKPTRTGYSFLGWSTDKNAVKAQYQPGGTYTENKNVTLYAVWKENTYIITYYMNDGTDTIFKKVTNQGTILSTVPTREGYEFIGWNTQSNATTAQYQPNDTLSSIQNMSLYAVWKEKQTVIPGDINGDGKVNMKDATRLHQYINGWEVPVVEAALDVNDDGKVNMKDVTRLHQYINGWDVKIYVK